MPNTSQNARLNELLAESEASIDSAESTADLLKVIHEFASYDGPLKFNCTRAWCFFGTGLLLIAGTVVLFGYINSYPVVSFFHSLQIEPGLFGAITVALGIGFAVESMNWMKSKAERLPSLSSKIARLSSYFHNGVFFLEEDSKWALNKLDAQFGDYRRGNYSRELVESIEGVFTGTLRELPYHYRQLHYVNKRKVQVTVTDKDGKTRTETRVVYDHYDRYSLTLDFPWVTGISVRSDDQSENDYSWPMDTASPDFNKSFCLTGQSEILCAKFIKPSTVLHLLKLFEILDRPNLEFSDNGLLCLSFASNDLLAFGTEYSLASPNDFYAEISAGVELPRLMSVLQWSHALTELHDDNFTFTASPPNKCKEK
ncbi:hypothetical protein [Pseudomonas koreensis]|uniref:DUF3137 domain-containing protein n=1 Tax=Pseudomonas koreensis TaxID=198620 RepID=A0A9X3B2C2_9PSED|nr:hypothetical protein [Pseudomonas koreensis]MCU7248041.1 hypothetical protein [Pseudomonas koreensis]